MRTYTVDIGVVKILLERERLRQRAITCIACAFTVVFIHWIIPTASIFFICLGIALLGVENGIRYVWYGNSKEGKTE